jgi:hypothetical protein
VENGRTLKELTMKKGLLERLEIYPELKKLTEEMLDIVEDTTDSLQRADEAEMQVVYNIRKMGAAV